MSEWINILEQQPEQGQRILARDGSQLICNYDRFNFDQWGITHWKPMPWQKDGQRQSISSVR